MEKRIEIKSQTKPILKAMFFFNGCLMFCGIPLLVFLIFQELSVLSLFISIAVVVLTFLAASKYHENALAKEYLLLDAESVTLVNQI